LPPGAQTFSIDPTNNKAYLYLNPDVAKQFGVGTKFPNATEASAYDFLKSLNQARGAIIMTPLPPFPVDFVPTGRPRSAGEIIASKADPQILTAIANFLAGKFKGKGRFVTYEADGISIRRQIVGMKEEVLKGSGLWEKLDIFITVVPADSVTFLAPVLD